MNANMSNSYGELISKSPDSCDEEDPVGGLPIENTNLSIQENAESITAAIVRDAINIQEIAFEPQEVPDVYEVVDPKTHSTETRASEKTNESSDIQVSDVYEVVDRKTHSAEARASEEKNASSDIQVPDVYEVVDPNTHSAETRASEEKNESSDIQSSTGVSRVIILNPNNFVSRVININEISHKPNAELVNENPSVYQTESAAAPAISGIKNGERIPLATLDQNPRLNDSQGISVNNRSDQQNKHTSDAVHTKTPVDFSSHKPMKVNKIAFSCKICGTTFNSFSFLKIHHQESHPERPHICTICCKGFKTKQGLRQHIKIHSDDRPFTCDVCGKNFKQRGALTNHLKLHTDTPSKPARFVDKNFGEKAA